MRDTRQEITAYLEQRIEGGEVRDRSGVGVPWWLAHDIGDQILEQAQLDWDIRRGRETLRAIEAIREALRRQRFRGPERGGGRSR